jgi:flagellar biosynthesis/type III secretory pathway protein FliH
MNKEKREIRLNKLLDKCESLKGELDEIMQEIEQTALDYYDDGNESGYKEGCEETEKKATE